MTGGKAKPPILVHAKSGRVYVVTSYYFHNGGVCIPLVKFDVTGQFEHICRDMMSGDANKNLPPSAEAGAPRTTHPPRS